MTSLKDFQENVQKICTYGDEFTFFLVGMVIHAWKKPLNLHEQVGTDFL